MCVIYILLFFFFNIGNLKYNYSRMIAVNVRYVLANIIKNYKPYIF